MTAIQLLNYSNVSRDNFNVRDLKETMPEPNVLLNKKIVLDDATPVSRIWVASLIVLVVPHKKLFSSRIVVR